VKDTRKNDRTEKTVRQGIGQRKVHKVGIIDDLRAFLNAVMFLVGTPEMPEGFKITVPEAHRELSFHQGTAATQERPAGGASSNGYTALPDSLLLKNKGKSEYKGQ